jgi:TRAP-type C4-dicarboxylate transport system substrate-binding protein
MNARIYRGPAWVVLTVALAMGAAACGPRNLDKAGGPVPKPVVLTLANDSGDLSGAQPFATAVAEVSHGALQIRIEGPSGRLGDPDSETGLVRAVQAGKAQLGITGTQAFDAVAGSFQALQAPFLIDSYALQRKVLASDLSQKMLAALKPTGLVGLGFLPGVLARPFSFSRPFLATSETDVFAADTAFHRSGATLTGNVVFWPWPGVIFMNRRAFESLTAGQRSDLSRAAAKARAAKIYLGNDTAYLRDLCRRGTRVVTASPADLAGLRVAVQPVYRSLEANPATRVFLNEITAMRRAVGSSPDSLTCASDRNIDQGSTAVSPLEGTWQVTYTKQELLAAGADPTQIYLSEETWGHFSLKFSSGYWWLRLTGGDPAVPPNYRLAYGTYVVDGDRVLFHRRDHDYLGSGTEVWGPYIWSVYRGTLTFKRDGWTGGAQGPAGLVVEPWRKSGT